MKISALPAATFTLALMGCSTIIEGSSQTITLNSNPSGARCTLERNGLAIGNVETPGGIVVEKTKDNITVVCSKDGYQTSTHILKSGVAGATFGNIILGGGIGWAIDSASGSDNKYDDVVNVTLTPMVDVPAMAPAAPPPAAAQPVR